MWANFAVVALDVGHGQLSPSIRSDQRVTVVEGVNARYLEADQLQGLSDRASSIDLVVADFTSATATM